MQTLKAALAQVIYHQDILLDHFQQQEILDVT